MNWKALLLLTCNIEKSIFPFFPPQNEKDLVPPDSSKDWPVSGVTTFTDFITPRGHRKVPSRAYIRIERRDAIKLRSDKDTYIFN